jgi:hypothetical protein
MEAAAAMADAGVGWGLGLGGGGGHSAGRTEEWLWKGTRKRWPCVLAVATRSDLVEEATGVRTGCWLRLGSIPREFRG